MAENTLVRCTCGRVVTRWPTGRLQPHLAPGGSVWCGQLETVGAATQAEYEDDGALMRARYMAAWKRRRRGTAHSWQHADADAHDKPVLMPEAQLQVAALQAVLVTEAQLQLEALQTVLQALEAVRDELRGLRDG